MGDIVTERTPTPAAERASPLALVIAAGVVGIAIGFGLAELRPPSGTDVSPTPSSVAEQTAAPTPSVSASPEPEASPPTVPLASGGDACADGEDGFSIVVPDGWYANLHQDDLMSCAYLAQEPFDPLAAGSDPDVDVPIRLTTFVDPTPPGTVVEQGDGDSAWIVERDGEEWLVHVVELSDTLGDEPGFLHLAARAADQEATDALGSIIDGLTITDPLIIDPGAVADAEALFADADVCSDLERGVNVILPDEWWTNTVFEDLLPCTYFAPARFEVGDTGEVPDGVAITLELVTGNVATIEEIIGFETLIVDGHPATRWELTPGLGDPPPDTDVYQYVVELGETPDGPSLVVTVRSEGSDDYERDKAILDEMMRRLIISPTPTEVLAVGPLPSCGWELVELTADGLRYDVESRDCLWEAYEAGDPAEMVSTGQMIEGGTVREIYRILGAGEIEWIIDSTHDPHGQGGWQLLRCTGLEQRADDELTDAILFDPTSCDDPIVLDP